MSATTPPPDRPRAIKCLTSKQDIEGRHPGVGDHFCGEPLGHEGENHKCGGYFGCGLEWPRRT